MLNDIQGFTLSILSCTQKTTHLSDSRARRKKMRQVIESHCNFHFAKQKKMTITMLMTMIKTIWSEWIVNLTSTRRRRTQKGRKWFFHVNKKLLFCTSKLQLLSAILTLLNKDIKWLNLITAIRYVYCAVYKLRPFFIRTEHCERDEMVTAEEFSSRINTCKLAIYISFNNN